MKHTVRSAIALILCLVLCLMAGCGGEKKDDSKVNKPIEKPTRPAVTEAPTEAPTKAPTEAADNDDEVYSISAYFDNDEVETSFNFYSDYTVYVSDADYELEGTYYFQGNKFHLELDGDSYDGFLDKDDNIVIPGIEGYFYEVGEVGYYPDEEPVVSEGNKEYKDKGDGMVRYYDYDGDIAITYPEWMTCYEDTMFSGSVLIGADEESYVFGDNVTEAYYDYDGYDEDFVLEYLNDEILFVFEQLYGGDIEGDSLTILEPINDFNNLVTAEINLYNDDYDRDVYILMYHAIRDHELQDEVYMKVFFVEYGDEDQMEYLKDNVKGCAGV